VDLNKESLLKQFQIVKQETNTSHVMQYGELVRCFDIIAFLVIYLYLLLTYNRGQKSLAHLCNLTNYLCFTTEV